MDITIDNDWWVVQSMYETLHRLINIINGWWQFKSHHPILLIIFILWTIISTDGDNTPISSVSPGWPVSDSDQSQSRSHRADDQVVLRHSSGSGGLTPNGASHRMVRDLVTVALAGVDTGTTHLQLSRSSDWWLPVRGSLSSSAPPEKIDMTTNRRFCCDIKENSSNRSSG